MHFTRPTDLLLGALVGLGVGYVVFDLAYGAMGGIPTLAGTTLLVLAVVEGIMAYRVRARVRSGVLTEAVVVARLVALAKASSLLGAIMTGGWLGAIAFLAPKSSRLAAASDDLPGAVVGVVCAAALVGAALWLEHCCRTPESSEPDGPESWSPDT